jgi:hypothetical protein
MSCRHPKTASARSASSQAISRMSRLSRAAAARSRTPAGLGRVAALREGFVDVRLQLFVDLAVQTVAAKHVFDARPKRHIDTILDFIIYRRLSNLSG